MNCPITNTPCPEKKCIHITDVNENAVAFQTDLCINCGEKVYEQSLPDNYNKHKKPQNNSIENLFNFIDVVLKNIKSMSLLDIQVNKFHEEKNCPSCKSTIKDIVTASRLGCAECYNFFKNELIVVINKTQGSLRHTGKQPVKLLPKEKQLDKLYTQLKILIQQEKYEEASVITKQIKDLEKDG